MLRINIFWGDMPNTKNTESFSSAKRKIILYLFVVTVFTIVLVLFANTWVSEQKVNSIAIKGTSYIPKNELFELINNISASRSFDRISLFNLKKKIKEHPFVSEAFVVKRNSKSIEIEVIERQVKAILIDKNGGLHYIDSDFNVLPYRLSLKFADLPVLQGYYLNDKIDTFSVINAIKLIEKIEENTNHLDISEINYNSKTKEYSLITSNFDFPILFGKMSNIEEKIRKLLTITPKVLNTTNYQNLAYIDLRWEDKLILNFNDLTFLDSKEN